MAYQENSSWQYQYWVLVPRLGLSNQPVLVKYLPITQNRHQLNAYVYDKICEFVFTLQCNAMQLVTVTVYVLGIGEH